MLKIKLIINQIIMLKNKFCFQFFYYYDKKYQKKIYPNTKISEIRKWLKTKGINEYCTFFFDDNILGEDDCTINDIVNGEFEEIKNIKINIRDLELERKKEEERLEKETIQKKKIEKEKNFIRDTYGAYTLEKTNNNMIIQKYPDNPFNNNEEQICKTIMVIGQTGSGKTTLLNSLINYILDIKLTDKKRFRIIQEYNAKQVNSVTAFTSIHYIKSHNNYPYIKIIDTPGLGDTKGMYKDREINAQLIKLLNEEIDKLDAICFVIKSSDVRLTTVQKYIFNSIIDLFDKDMREKFIIMLTFSDPNKPKILDALKSPNSGFENIIQYLEKDYYLKFNCSSIFNDEINDEIVKIYWEMCMTSMKQFIYKIKNLKSQSLKKTRILLHYKQRRDILIESCIYFQNKLEDIENNKKTIENEIKIINENIKLSKDFNTVDQINITEKEKLPLGISTCTCKICQITCHENCKYPDDSQKRNCEIFDKNGNCTICPNHCLWNEHYNPIGFKLVKKNIKKISNNKELEDMNNIFINKEKEMNNKLEDVNKEISNYQNITKKFKLQISYVNQQMNEYRINPKTNKCFVEYINERIKQVKEEKKVNWDKNLKKLVLYKKQYELLYEIENNTYLKNYFEDIDNFINIPFIDEEEIKTKTFLFFGDNQMDKTQIIILFIKNFIDLSENEMYKFNNEEEQMTIYYIRAYNPQSYIKIIDIPIFNVNKRNYLQLMETIKNEFNEKVSNIDNIFLLFKDDRDLEDYIDSYINYFSMILEQFKDRFYILFYDNDTISYGNFNYLCLEDDNLYNIIIKNQSNFESKFVFQKIKGFYQNKNFPYLLKEIKKKTDGKYPINTKLFIESLKIQIILRKSLLSANALNSFKDLKKTVQNIINNNNKGNKKILNDKLDKIDTIIFEKMIDYFEKLKRNSLFKVIFEFSSFFDLLIKIELCINDTNTEGNIQLFKFMKFILAKIKNNTYYNNNLSKQVIELFQNYILN